MTGAADSPGGPAAVLVVGDANVDLVLRGDVVPRFGQAEQLLDQADLVLGGSASIVAVGLARLGVPTSLVAVVGDDAFGATAVAALADAGVDTASIERRDGGSTGISVILSAPDDRAILTLLGTIPLLSADHVRAAVTRSRARWVHFASPFLIGDALVTALPDLLAELREAGIGTSLDTNWDPAERWAGIAETLGSLDALMPNNAELLALGAAVAGESTIDSAAAALTARGARVVVKDGAAGGWAQGPDGVRHRAPGLRLDVVDTTGAGDSFDAGYLAAIAHGVVGEAERVRWAAVAGSLSTRAAGGTGAQATLDELRAAVAP